MSEEDQEDVTPEQARASLGGLVGQIQEFLDAHADESVLDQEHVAMKRLMETLMRRMEETILSTEFFVPEMADEMRQGWEDFLTQARHLAGLGGDDNGVWVSLGEAMVRTIDDWKSHRMEIKDTVPTPELRKMLTQVRTAITHVGDAMWNIERLAQMEGAVEKYQHYIERQTLEMTAQRDYGLEVEAAIVRSLEKRGERVPKWRNRPKLEK